MLLPLLGLPVLAAIAWEDLRDRSIHWWLLPLLVLALLPEQLLSHGWQEQVRQSAWSLLFLAFQLGLAVGFVRLRQGATLRIKDLIGLGDVLFLLAVAVCLPTERYILFVVIGLSLCVPMHVLLQRISEYKDSTIPLAGLLAIVLGVWIMASACGIPAVLEGLTQSVLAHEH